MMGPMLLDFKAASRDTVFVLSALAWNGLPSTVPCGLQRQHLP